MCSSISGAAGCLTRCGQISEQRQEYFNSYIEIFLMQDSRRKQAVLPILYDSEKFLNACAALTAEQVNYKTLAEAAEISQPTAKTWLRILQGLGIIYLLPPFANNDRKESFSIR